MIKTKGLVHFTIPVTDTAKSRDFYCQILGMKLLQDTGPRGMVFLDSGGDCIILAKVDRPISTAGAVDVHHSFLVAHEEYAAALVRATIPRSSKFAPGGAVLLPADEMIGRFVAFGSSPRGGQALLLGAKVRALLAGRVNVSYEDIDRVAVPALNHRLVLNFAARADDVDPRALIQRLLDAAKRLHH